MKNTFKFLALLILISGCANSRYLLSDEGREVLILLEDKEISESEMYEIEPNDIESIDVIKDSEMIKKILLKIMRALC